MTDSQENQESAIPEGEAIEIKHVDLATEEQGHKVSLKESDKTQGQMEMYVGGTEFASIAKELGLIEPPRPLTHEIYLKLVSGLGISFQKLEIYGMEENAFLARLYYTKSEQPKMMEIRPSDGLALALNKKTPIFIHKRLLKGTLSPQDQDTLNDLVKSVKF